ncbi:MAG: hypothetical protein PF637_07520 [Spirochaetes bacterium]|jgi:hypothetical protein|nr:hypothetical protein [Spirochaetota bacterium]
MNQSSAAVRFFYKIIFNRQISYYQEWINALGLMNFKNSFISYGEYRKLTLRLVYEPPVFRKILQSPVKTLFIGGHIRIEIFGFKLPDEESPSTPMIEGGSGRIQNITVRKRTAEITIGGLPEKDGDEEYRTVETVINRLIPFSISATDQ